MKNLLLIILIAFICISASVTTNTVINVPAKPKIVFCTTADSKDASFIILEMVKQGYIVKSTERTAGNNIGVVLIIMEKY